MSHPTVTARGSSTVPARPDVSVWTLQVAHLAGSMQEALDDVGVRSRLLVDLCDELGVEPAARSTTEATVAEDFDYVEGRQQRRGFRASATLTVRLGDLGLGALLVARAVDRAGAEVRGPSWLVAPDNPARREACARAAAEARAKAAAYAEALGLRLGGVVEVRDAESVPPGPRPMGAARAVAYESSLEITPGEVEVAAAVDVTFRLEAGA